MTDIRFARQDVEQPKIARALARAEDPREAVDIFLDAVAEISQADVLALALADEEAERASGFAIRGGDETWFRSVSIDLANDIGGIATVARERIAFTVYDAAAAANVNQHLVEALNVKSAAFVPMTAEERFVGALVVASCTDRRHFSTELVEAIQRLADETAPVLRRMRSADALRRALERERLVGDIARKVRSELDLDDVLAVAVGEIGRGLGVARCFIRLGTSPEGAPVRAEWAAPGIEPIGTVPERLAVSNLAIREGRTIAIGDIEDSPALDDEALGGRAALTSLGTKAALATPVFLFDEQVGVFSLHRTHTGAWSANDIAVAESVAGEVGVAIHVARLLAEDERQARIQLGFYRIAQLLGSTLSLGQTLDALATAAAEALGGDAAFVLEPSGAVLRLAGSYELPPALAAALAEGIPAAQTPLADAGRQGKMLVSSLQDDDRFDSRRADAPHEERLRLTLRGPCRSRRERVRIGGRPLQGRPRVHGRRSHRRRPSQRRCAGRARAQRAVRVRAERAHAVGAPRHRRCSACHGSFAGAGHRGDRDGRVRAVRRRCRPGPRARG